MTDRGVAYLLWSDLANITRTRGVPLRDLPARMEAGLGWAAAGQALTPFEDIVDNVWGPMDEARQVPDPEARYTIPAAGEHRAVHTVICDSRWGLDEDWECCARTFYRRALEALKAETGLSFLAAFEHEFIVEAPGFVPQTPFSLTAVRHAHGFLEALCDTFQDMGLRAETIEPEYGLAQYEVSCAPEVGVKAADVCLMTRETIREVARRHGLHASFTPKPSPTSVGNGAHAHFSFRDAQGRNVTHDPAGTLGLSPLAARFCAGILAHVEALVAVTAASPVSYYRLGPHHWSCGFRAIGLQNREATLRVCPGVSSDPARRAASFNVEYRPIDGTASPYLSLGLLVHAGLDGIRRRLDLQHIAERDPADMTPAERAQRGIAELPSDLDSALAALEADPCVREWMAPNMLATYVAIKRWEARFSANAPTERVFARYRQAF